MKKFLQYVLPIVAVAAVVAFAAPKALATPGSCWSGNTPHDYYYKSCTYKGANNIAYGVGNSTWIFGTAGAPFIWGTEYLTAENTVGGKTTQSKGWGNPPGSGAAYGNICTLTPGNGCDYWTDGYSAKSGYRYYGTLNFNEHWGGSDYSRTYAGPTVTY